MQVIWIWATRFGSNPGTNSSRLELGLPGLRGVRIRPNSQFSSLDLGLPSFKGVRIKPNSQFSSSELGLLSISEVRYSHIEKNNNVSEIDLLSIRKI